MPIYEYACSNCGHELEVEQRIIEDALTDCPKCEASSLERLVSRTSFALKGSGWYADGYGGKGKAAPEAKAESASASGSAAASDSGTKSSSSSDTTSKSSDSKAPSSDSSGAKSTAKAAKAAKAD